MRWRRSSAPDVQERTCSRIERRACFSLSLRGIGEARYLRLHLSLYAAETTESAKAQNCAQGSWTRWRRRDQGSDDLDGNNAIDDKHDAAVTSGGSDYRDSSDRSAAAYAVHVVVVIIIIIVVIVAVVVIVVIVVVIVVVVVIFIVVIVIVVDSCHVGVGVVAARADTIHP